MSESVGQVRESYKREGFAAFCCAAITTEKNKNGQEKKTFKPPVGHDKITLSNCDEYNEGPSLCIGTGKRSNLTVVDFDDREVYSKVIEKFPELKKVRTIRTNKGYHLYFKYDPMFTSTSEAFKTLRGVDVKTDGGFVFAAPTKYKLLDGTTAKYEDLGGEITEMHQFFINDLKRKKDQNVTYQVKLKQQAKQEVASGFGVLSHNENDVHTITKMIDDGLLDHKAFNFSDWVQVGMAMKECVGFELFDKFSKRCPDKYDQNKTIDCWNSFKGNKSKKLQLGSLIFWAKQSDKYDGRFNKIEGDVMTDDEIARYLFEQHKEKLIKNKDILYAYYKNQWTESIEDVFKQWLSVSTLNVNKAKDKPVYVKSLTSRWHNFITQLNCLCTEELETVDLLDKQKDILPFQDGYYDFKLRRVVKYTTEEVVYFTYKVKRNFPVRNQKQIDEVRDVLQVIFDGNESLLTEVLQCIARGLGNNVQDKVGLCLVGERNSAKGFLMMMLVNSFMGTIGNIISNDLVTKKNSMESAERRNGFMKNFCENLICISEEVNSKTKLDGTIWKSIVSGGDTVSYRTAYGTLTEKSVRALYLITCNKTPSFDLLDARETMLLCNMPCKFYETMPEDGIDRGFTIKQADPNIKGKFVQCEFIDAFIHLILEHYTTEKPAYPILTEMNKEDFEVDEDFIDTGDALQVAVNNLYTINKLDTINKIKCSDVHKRVISQFAETSAQKVKTYLKRKGVIEKVIKGYPYYYGISENVVPNQFEETL